MLKLENLTKDAILHGRIPLPELLEDSVYYPASSLDGRPIKYCNTIWRDMGVKSFVYCDFLPREQEVIRELPDVLGYHLLAHRSLSPDEYIPEDWELELSGWDRDRYFDTFLGNDPDFKPFAHWAVYERDHRRGEEHGPKRFSLLFIGGEGLATFQRLYCHHHVHPKMICFLQCWGFAGNWTDFTSAHGSFCNTMRLHPECVPEWLCIGWYDVIESLIHIRNTEDLGVRAIRYIAAGFRPKRARDIMTPVEGHEEDAFTLKYRGKECLAINVGHTREQVIYDITDSHEPAARLVEQLLRGKGISGHDRKLIA